MGEKRTGKLSSAIMLATSGQFLKKMNIYDRKSKNNEHRSFPYDPRRSKTKVVRFRTIRIVQKRTMTYRPKKYTKKLYDKTKPTLLISIDIRLPIP